MEKPSAFILKVKEQTQSYRDFSKISRFFWATTCAVLDNNFKPRPKSGFQTMPATLRLPLYLKEINVLIKKELTGWDRAY